MPVSQLRLRMCAVAAVVVIVATAAHAQHVPETSGVRSKGLRYEVASVRPSPDSQRLSRRPSPGRFRVTGFPLGLLLAQAYEIGQARIIMPDWARRARFDIDATMPADATPSQRLEMLRGLLEDRFSVAGRHELRSMPVLALVRVRDDGRLGPQLQQVQRECARKDPDGRSACSWTENVGLRIARGLTWDDIALANVVESYLGTPVVDRSRLSGQFDLRLEWQESLADVPDQRQRPSSLEGALREQLGLKLERVREDVEVLVIERISMPSPN